jgi:hypothetical protein
MQALEVHIAYKLPHNHSLASEGEEDDLYVEVLLQGAPSSSSQASATTVLVLRGHPKDQDTATTTKKGEQAALHHSYKTWPASNILTI